LNKQEQKEILREVYRRKLLKTVNAKIRPIKHKKKLKMRICSNCHKPTIPKQFNGYRCRLCHAFPICQNCYIKQYRICEFCYTKLRLKGAVKDEMFTMQTQT